MKLNNRGWGLGIFVVFLVMFFLFLLLIAFLANRYSEKFISDFYYGYSYNVMINLK